LDYRAVAFANPVPEETMRNEPHRQDHEIGVFAILIDEHRQIADDFEALDRIADADARTAMFERIARELLAHAHAEQAIVYHRLDHSRELEKEIERSAHQHAHIENLIRDIRMHDAAGSAWAVRMEELRRAVEEHIDEEERDVIPRAHLVIDDRAVIELATWYDAEKKLELERLRLHH
jgi:hypothetical protein